MQVLDQETLRNSLFVLGAPDPEMEAIERLLREHSRPFQRGVAFAYATLAGARVSPSNAYKAAGFCVPPSSRGPSSEEACAALRGAGPLPLLVLVECGGPFFEHARVIERCDHHNPGDEGYGRPPSDYWWASSIGQVHELLDGDVPDMSMFYHAAADHCLAAAYAGQCPPVDPETLRKMRLRQRANLLNRTVELVMDDWHLAKDEIEMGRGIIVGGVPCADLRELPGGTMPEANEVAAWVGKAVVYRMAGDPARGTRTKVGIIGAGEGTLPGRAPIEAFLRGEGPAAGLVDLYGDPARGFAGGYEP